MGVEQIYDRNSGRPVAQGAGQNTDTVKRYVLAHKSAILAAIDSVCMPPLRGAGVIFVVGWDVVVLRRPIPGTLLTVVMKVQRKIEQINAQEDNSALCLKLAGLALNGMGLVAGFLLLGGEITLVAGIGLAIGVAATGLTLGQVINLIGDPTGQSNAYENEDWYQNATLALDVLGLATAGLAALPRTSMLLAKFSARGGRQLMLGPNASHKQILDYVKKNFTTAEKKEFFAAMNADLKATAAKKGMSNTMIRKNRAEKSLYVQRSFQRDYANKLGSILPGITQAGGSAIGGAVNNVLVYVYQNTGASPHGPTIAETGPYF